MTLDKYLTLPEAYEILPTSTLDSPHDSVFLSLTPPHSADSVNVGFFFLSLIRFLEIE